MALHPVDEPGPYPAEVRHRIRRDVATDYAYVARALNECGVKVVCVQHEFGIWGGADGAYVLDFVGALRVPVVATLHTVLAQPTPDQREIVRDLVGMAEKSVVMTRASAVLLSSVYGVDSTRVDVVPHGIPHLPFVASDTAKPRLGLRDRTVILSFGLIGPGKGFESVIEAMPAVVKAVPSVCYVILGATHPGILAHDGEAYRAGLQARVTALGMGEHVQFVDRFVGRVELGTWLEAADIVTTPYPNLDQSTSGTLAYGMGAGRAIVSTPYAYATELLAEGRGRLVPSRSPAALAEAFVELLSDHELRIAMGRRAYEHTRGMVWWEVGAAYRRIFDRAAGVAGAAVTVPFRPARDLAAAIV
ncbi:MAG: glycosyltransferase family 4 protein [Candidatus Limnocylindrales bacterium]